MSSIQRLAATVLSFQILLLAAVGGCERAQQDAAGKIKIDGSSTVAPLTQAVVSEFQTQNRDIRISVGTSGTGGGFKRFCVADTDISNASRHIKPAEIEIARDNSVSFIELPVAIDGITIAVHKDNNWVDHLTIDEIARIFVKGSDIRTWADIRDGWPDSPIDLYAPGTASGTFDFFREVVFPDGSDLRLEEISTSEDDHILVRGIAGNRNALGFFGFAFYTANKDALRSIPIVSPTGQAVRPSIDTILNAEYRPFSRPLFIYVNADRADRSDIDTFVNFYLDNVTDLVEHVGYAPLPPDILSISKARFNNRTTGTVWIDDQGQSIHAPLRSVYTP